MKIVDKLYLSNSVEHANVQCTYILFNVLNFLNRIMLQSEKR